MEEEQTSETASAGGREKFTRVEVNEIRGLTGILGGVVERVVLEIWKHRGVEDLPIDISELRKNCLGLIGSFDDAIGVKRLYPVELAHICKDVVNCQRSMVLSLFEQVDIICKASNESFSFAPNFPLIIDPNYKYTRFWVEAALMIAKEARFKPIIELEDYFVINKGIRVRNGEVIFDGMVVPFIPGLGSDFERIQTDSIEWYVIEMKSIFIWWRVGGKNPLSATPPEYIHQVDSQLSIVADFFGKDYYPDHGIFLSCLRGWRATRIFCLPWWSSEWIMIERELHY